MVAATHFVDANVPMYAVGAEHPLKRPCVAILHAIARGELAAVTDVEVLQEILHRYTAIGQRQRAGELVRLFLEVVPEALPITTDDMLAAVGLHAAYSALQARDALHAAVMQRHEIGIVISADRHFESLPGITRIDPADWQA